VRLTREIQIGAALHRLLDALRWVEDAAHVLTLPPASPDKRVFRNCQAVLAGSAAADLPFPMMCATRWTGWSKSSPAMTGN
jgi:hypothetical protein